MGLSYLKANAPDLNANPEMLAFVQNYTDMGFFSILLFLFIGTILTMTPNTLKTKWANAARLACVLAVNAARLAVMGGPVTDMGFFSILLFLFIGTILTMIVQASAATMAITLIMCANGWISLELGAALVLGENIGTTITANLAALQPTHRLSGQHWPILFLMCSV